MKRVFLFVLDSFGIGAAKDAARFGDTGTNTLKRIESDPNFSAENLRNLGLFNIESVDCGSGVESPEGAVLRLSPLSAGKDTTVGHWEIAGLISKKPLPTYPLGFPKELLAELSAKTGRKILCNKPYSGTAVIEDFGDEHMKTKGLIVYTSADSVFQIAAHEDIIPIEELYKICETAREILSGEHGVGRVIARPFKGEAGNFYRTANRHDFSLSPPNKTLLDYITEAGLSVFAIGKINDIFAGQGIGEYIYTKSNSDGMKKSLTALSRECEGLTFINLVDFDMVYGHREDIKGYAAAISEFDKFLPSFIKEMREDDLLIITADHGCDPGDGNTDHTREDTPLIIYGKNIKPGNFGVRSGFCTIAATIADYLSVPYGGAGESILKDIYKD